MFAILFEALLIEIQEEIPHFPGWEGGGVNEHKNCEQKFCEQTGVSYLRLMNGPLSFKKQLSGPLKDSRGRDL